MGWGRETPSPCCGGVKRLPALRFTPHLQWPGCQGPPRALAPPPSPLSPAQRTVDILRASGHPGGGMNSPSSCPNSCPIGLLVPSSGASACLDQVSFLLETLLLSALLNLTEVWMFKNKVTICFVILLKLVHSVSLCSWLPFVPRL